MGMDMTGSSWVDGKDGGIRIGRGERVQPRVMWVRKLGASTRMSEYRCVKLEQCRRHQQGVSSRIFLSICECIVFYIGYRRRR